MEYFPENYKYEYKLISHPGEICIVNRSTEEKFISEFCFPLEKGQIFRRVNWDSVSKKYSGVLISGELLDKKSKNFYLWTRFDVETLVIWSKGEVELVGNVKSEYWHDYEFPIGVSKDGIQIRPE